MAKRVKEALLNRLETAIKDLYHAATPKCYGICKEGEEDAFWSFVLDAGSREIDYIQEGLGCDKQYWRRQRKLGFQHNERYFYLVTQITVFGKLYQWGRGGRTVAPDRLVSRRGGSCFSLVSSDTFAEESNAWLTEYIQIIEAFGHYVKNWNSKESMRSLYDAFCEYKEDAA